METLVLNDVPEWLGTAVLGAVLAALGYVGPIVAAILHNVGSFIVIFNSARLVRKGEELEHYHPQTETPANGGSGSRHDATGQLEPRVV